MSPAKRWSSGCSPAWWFRVVTIWLTLRKFVKRPARELLVGRNRQATESKVQSLRSKVIGGRGAAGWRWRLVGWAVAKGDTANAGVFFGAGRAGADRGIEFCQRVAGTARRSAGLRPGAIRRCAATNAPSWRSALRSHWPRSPLRGCARRRKRSLATVAMLACGSFLIVSIGVFRLDANRDATKRSSGTGGFALIGETTMPVVQDLNSQVGPGVLRAERARS